MSVAPTIALEDREALRRLIEIGKMIRRADGSYGTTRKTLLTRGVAVRLKARRLAIPGFNNEIVASPKRQAASRGVEQ